MKNFVLLIGRVGQDPSSYEFDDGNKITKFSLATSESYKTKEGEWKENTEWHNVVVRRDFKTEKGDLVLIEGAIKTRKYKDKDGNERYITEVVSSRARVLTRINDSQPVKQETKKQSPKEKVTTTQQDLDNMPEDDLPF